MNDILFNHEKNVYSLELTHEEYQQFLVSRSNNGDYFCLYRKNLYYRILSHRDISVDHRYINKILSLIVTLNLKLRLTLIMITFQNKFHLTYQNIL